jgi:hypothetical protein
MNDTARPQRAALDEGREQLVASRRISIQPTALITEQQVLLSTAAAVAPPPARTRRWSDTISEMTAAIGGWFVSAARAPRPVYGKRHVWLEKALMSREMDRL